MGEIALFFFLFICFIAIDTHLFAPIFTHSHTFPQSDKPLTMQHSHTYPRSVSTRTARHTSRVPPSAAAWRTSIHCTAAALQCESLSLSLSLLRQGETYRGEAAHRPAPVAAPSVQCTSALPRTRQTHRWPSRPPASLGRGARSQSRPRRIVAPNCSSARGRRRSGERQSLPLTSTTTTWSTHPRLKCTAGTNAATSATNGCSQAGGTGRVARLLLRASGAK